jgi:hypothetical protein
MTRLTVVLVLALGLTMSANAAAAGDEIRLNQVQVIGTHNSYHIAPDANVLGLVAAASRRQAEALDYTHRPLAEQFSLLGIRQIELDVFADPKGGHYATPSTREVLRRAGKPVGPDPDEGGQLRQPGLKVLHLPDIDYRTTVSTFARALREVRAWSSAHPRHVPILVLVELKDRPIPTGPTRPVEFTGEMLDTVDAEILSVFDRSAIITPDSVRGSAGTLPQALKDRGWPGLEACRGRVMFALDNEDRLRDLYLEGHPALRDRLMFVSVAPEHPAAAWMKVNDPVRDFDRIRALVRGGFLVRTRADADTVEARKNDPSRRDKALASGAQFVSTDYPEPRLTFSDYVVSFPGRVAARPNPINGDPSVADPEGPVERNAGR